MTEGRITAWESEVFMPERPMRRSGVTLLAAVLADLPKFGPAGAPLHNIGLGIPYAIPNNKLTAHWLVDTPLPAAWIRAPGRMQNTFGNESFLDEIAAAAGVDPFEIRVRYLKDPRGLELLERLRRLAKWEPRGIEAARYRHLSRAGRGVSYAKYELVRTYVGIVADVTVERATGHVKVDRVFVVHDCGQIINPDGLRNQIEGNVVQTVQPQHGREADIQPQCGHEPQLGKLSDPDFPECARGRHRSDRPAQRGAMGRGRADDIGRAVGDRERSLRRDWCARAIGAVPAGDRAGCFEFPAALANRLPSCRSPLRHPMIR